MKIEVNKMSGLGFNTSTRKEDVSTRLKTHNIKRAKDETQKLETESRKMEEKLRELRLAMTKEKEDRERRGGGFWSRGQTGNLNNYATDVLNKPVRASKDGSGKKKVKVLKDTPVELPERPSQPGTMAFIAKQGENQTPRKGKVKGPKCGQCEERKAAVSCFQCSELYCAGCFASFHLKGALKKHRSIPISAIGPRQCMSPQPSSRDSYDSQVLAVEDSVSSSITSSIQKSRNGPEGASVSYDGHDNGPSLLDGTYDERENAMAFQEALMAWRTGDQPNHTAPRQNNPTPRKAYTPVKTPTVQMDIGTDTVETKPDVEIKFNTSNLSYAERLMLKKHRRTELDRINTPRIDHSDSQLSTPRIDYDPISTSPLQFDRMNTAELSHRERVDFHALYEAVTQVSPPDMGPFDRGDLTITELDNSHVNTKVDETSSFMVEEVGEIQAWSIESESLSPSTRVPQVDKKYKSTQAARTVRQSSAKEPSRRTPSVLEEINMNITESVNRSKSARKRSRNPDSDNMEINPQYFQPYSETDLVKSVPSINSRPPSAAKSKVQSRPQSTAKSRPQSAATRPGSRQWQESRPSSSFSRASSRLQGEGVLTKSSSDELQKVAMMSHAIMDNVYTSALSNFLMLGVEPVEEERTLTPTKNKHDKEEKYKISNKLYQMAPRSWRPSSSLADNVPDDQAETIVREETSRLSNYDQVEPFNRDETSRLSTYDQVEPFNREETASVLSFVQNEKDIVQLTESASFENNEFSNGFSRTTPTNDLRHTPTPPGVDRQTPTPRRVSSRHSYRQTEREDTLPELPKTPINLRSITPKPSSTAGSLTPRPTSRSRSFRSSSQMGTDTPRPTSRAMSSLSTEDGRASRAIVVDGEDLSTYDEVGKTDIQDQEDTDTLDKLEWELASETGRITADGKLSRISVIEDLNDGNSTDSSVDSRAFSRMSQQDQGYDINSRLREDELMDDMEDEQTQEDEVKALH